MTRLRALLRDAWTLIRPYWFSEDRWAGRGLLAAVIDGKLSVAAE